MYIVLWLICGKGTFIYGTLYLVFSKIPLHLQICTLGWTFFFNDFQKIFFDLGLGFFIPIILCLFSLSMVSHVYWMFCVRYIWHILLLMYLFLLSYLQTSDSILNFMHPPGDTCDCSYYSHFSSQFPECPQCVGFCLFVLFCLFVNISIFQDLKNPFTFLFNLGFL